MPIINQPQVAILGVGTIEKRPVVVDDGDRDPDDGVPDARLRPPADRRRRGGSVHGRHQAAPRALRPEPGVVRPSRNPPARRSSPYQDALALQRALVEERRADRIPDLLLLLQHPPVITLGVKGDGGRSNVVADPRAARRARHRDFRDRPRRRRHLSRPRADRRLSDSRPPSGSLRRAPVRARSRGGDDSRRAPTTACRPDGSKG